MYLLTEMLILCKADLTVIYVDVSVYKAGLE